MPRACAVGAGTCKERSESNSTGRLAPPMMDTSSARAACWQSRDFPRPNDRRRPWRAPGSPESRRMLSRPSRGAPHSRRTRSSRSIGTCCASRLVTCPWKGLRIMRCCDGRETWIVPFLERDVLPFPSLAGTTWLGCQIETLFLSAISSLQRQRWFCGALPAGANTRLRRGDPLRR